LSRSEVKAIVELRAWYGEEYTKNESSQPRSELQMMKEKFWELLRIRDKFLETKMFFKSGCFCFNEFRGERFAVISLKEQ
jgi:hypothetical protein